MGRRGRDEKGVVHGRMVMPAVPGLPGETVPKEKPRSKLGEDLQRLLDMPVSSIRSHPVKEPVVGTRIIEMSGVGLPRNPALALKMICEKHVPPQMRAPTWDEDFQRLASYCEAIPDE